MNTLRWIPRSMVKALAAGAVLVAAVLPLAIATEAGAAVSASGATIAFTPYNLAGTTTGMTANVTAVGSNSSGVFTISGLTGLQNNGGTVAVAQTTGGTKLTFTKTAETATTISGTYDATGASTVASTTFSVNENGAGAVTSVATFAVDAAPTWTSTTPSTIVAGQTTAVAVVGTGFSTTGTLQMAVISANSGSAGQALTVTAVTDVDATHLTATVAANFGSSAAAVGTAYTTYIENPDGGIVSAASSLTVAASGITNVSPADITKPTSGSSTTAVTVNGAGFEPGATAGVGYVTSGSVPATSTALTIVANASITVGMVVTGPGISSGTTVSAVAGTAVTLSNALSAAGLGEYLFTFPAAVTAGAVVANGSKTLTAPQQTITTPDNVLTFTSGAGSDSLLIAVGDIVSCTGTCTGATYTTPVVVSAVNNSTGAVSLSGASPVPAIGAVLTFTPPISSTTGAVSTTSAALSVVVNHYATSGLYDVYVMNPPSGPTASAQAFLVGGLGVSTASNSVPVVTATALSPTGMLEVGSATTYTLTITGSGFGPSSSVAFGPGTTAGPSTVTASGCVANTTGTTLTCTVFAATNSVAGAYNVVVTNAAAGPMFTKALTVDGPVITAQAPASIGVGAAIGTVITLTGTGFSGTASGTISGGSGFNATFAEVSATTATLTLTGSPNSTDATNSAAGTNPTLNVNQVLANGYHVLTSYVVAIGPAPTVTGLAYVSGATTVPVTFLAGIGRGAVNMPIVITGTNFATGVTVGSFVDPNSVADAGVTVTNVVVVSATKLTASLSIAAADVNLSDGYTVTSANGASVKVAAYGTGALYIEAGPTIASVSPSAVTSSSTITFTLTGTGYKTGDSTVTSSSTNATCGSTTFVSTTSLTVACTFGVVTSAVSLVVTNNDGGMATIALTVPVVTPPAPGLHASRVVGHVSAGKTVTINILGTGFYGRPTVSSHAGTRALVTHDTGKMLTVRVTVARGSRNGMFTFTITLANGKSCKVHYIQRP